MTETRQTYALVPAPDSTEGLANLEPHGFMMQWYGLTAIGVPTFEQWQEAGWTLRLYGQQVTARARAYQLAIGDWVIYGRANFGEAFAQALDESDYEHKTLNNFAWVAAHVPPDLRLKYSDLTFEHFKGVADVEDEDEREGWLAAAQQNGWSGRELREQISPRASANGREITCPHCGGIFELKKGGKSK